MVKIYKHKSGNITYIRNNKRPSMQPWGIPAEPKGLRWRVFYFKKEKPNGERFDLTQVGKEECIYWHSGFRNQMLCERELKTRYTRHQLANPFTLWATKLLQKFNNISISCQNQVKFTFSQ